MESKPGRSTGKGASKTKKVSRRIDASTPKKAKKAKPPGEKGIPCSFLGFITWVDPMKKPESFILETVFDPKTDRAWVSLGVNLRSIASIELKPARRPLSDVTGAIRDAERIANLPIAKG